MLTHMARAIITDSHRDFAKDKNLASCLGHGSLQYSLAVNHANIEYREPDPERHRRKLCLN